MLLLNTRTSLICVCADIFAASHHLQTVPPVCIYFSFVFIVYRLAAHPYFAKSNKWIA